MGSDHFVLTEAVYYILLAVFEPLHGYGIMQKLETLSNGRVHLAAGTLYGALNTMMEKGWIASLPEEKNSRKKEYIITATGEAAFKAELERLKELVANGEMIWEAKK